ncbi:MAG: hypothetical protein P4L81_02230 [Candidatus Pacebacteria bacterium]|nr:hypothetical protein [Candidatus Paceibacterota bacterium]
MSVRHYLHHLRHRIEHWIEHLIEEIWSTLVNINSVLLALASLYTIYAAGASIYYWTLRPLEIGVTLVFILYCTEIIFAAIEEVAG